MSTLSLLCEGEKAPGFSFTEADGTARNTGELLGRPYLVYFYPKDDTPGCTKEACAFRDNHPEFLARGTTVIGVSPDDEDSHDTFRRKFGLPFALASDTDHRIAKAFGAWGPKQFMGRRYEGVHRVSFLVDGTGRIGRVYPKVKPEHHAKEILRDLETLS